MADENRKPRHITEGEAEQIVDYIRANQPCRAYEIADHIDRSHNAVQMLMSRDDRFTHQLLDNGNKLYSLAPEIGPYDLPLPCGIIHHHRAGSSKGKAHQPIINELCLFALQPWLVRRQEDERFNIGLQSPRLYAAD